MRTVHIISLHIYLSYRSRVIMTRSFSVGCITENMQFSLQPLRFIDWAFRPPDHLWSTWCIAVRLSLSWKDPLRSRFPCRLLRCSSRLSCPSSMSDHDDHVRLAWRTVWDWIFAQHTSQEKPRVWRCGAEHSWTWLPSFIICSCFQAGPPLGIKALSSQAVIGHYRLERSSFKLQSIVFFAKFQ